MNQNNETQSYSVPAALKTEPMEPIRKVQFATTENNKQDKCKSKFSKKYSRAGLNCSEVLDPCEEENWNYINMVDNFSWSPVADMVSLEKLLSWAYKMY